MLALFRDNYDAEHIQLNVRWFDKFLRMYNGASYYDHKPAHYTVELDVCLTGLGGRWKNLVYHLPLPEHSKNLGIVQIEIINILLAIRLFVDIWAHRLILIKCDNSAVVQVLKTSNIRDQA